MYDFERPSVLPVLALRGLCVFPNMLTHFDVGRKKSGRAVEEAMREDQRIFLVAQKDAQKDDPARSDLYEVGTVAIIRQVLRLPGSNMRILVEGVTRARLLDVVHTEPYLFARVIALPEQPANENLPKTQALMRQTLAQLDQFVGLAAKNAILIVEFAVRLSENPATTPAQAAVDAGKIRLRPIIMTSLAFIGGVIPLALATGAGANSRHSIGTGIIGGMIGVSTLALLFVPLFFDTFIRFARRIRQYFASRSQKVETSPVTLMPPDGTQTGDNKPDENKSQGGTP